LQADLTEELSEEMEIVTDDLSDDEIIRRLRNGEKVISERLQVLVENVEIPELVQIFEEDLEDEDVYINTLKNYL
jgi:short-subunit dehydrogenase